MKKRLCAILLFASLPALATAVSSATTTRAGAVSYIGGADGCGVVIKERSPIEIEEEIVTLHVSAFPSPEEKSTSFVRTQYTFFNPTEQDETLTLFIPGGEEAVGEDGEPLEPIETKEKFSMTTRHTFRAEDAFDAEEEVSRLIDTKREDGFYRTDLPVYCVKYSCIRENDRPCDYAHLLLRYDPDTCRVYFDNKACGAKSVVENGYARLTWEVTKDTCEISVYFFGELAEVVEEPFVTSDSEATKRVEDASFTFSASTQSTFEEFVAERNPDKEEVFDCDWHNACIDLLEDRCDNLGIIYVPAEWYSMDRLRTWYTYDLSIPQNSRVTNTVTAALQPTYGGQGTVYRYGFLLSPARKFSALGKITIRIETPYYLGYSNLNFKKTKGGYTLTREGLPLGELSFTLAETASSYKSANSGAGVLSPNMQLAIILLSVLVGGGGIAGVTTVIVLRRRHRRKP